jgi:regulator of sigma E protease
VSLTTILLGLLVLDLLIIIHELGHYVAARLCGLAVPQFSIGFGPRLFGLRRGETEYVVRLLPLGGFVLLPDLAREDHLPPVAGWRRTVTMLAGPLANLIFAILLVGPQRTALFVNLWINGFRMMFQTSHVDLAGPVGMTRVVGEAAAYGWHVLVAMVSLLSLNFGLMNLLPFPGLDGGRLLGIFAEWLNGGRRPRWEPAVQAIGILIILGLGLWVTGAEIVRVFD